MPLELPWSSPFAFVVFILFYKVSTLSLLLFLKLSKFHSRSDVLCSVLIVSGIELDAKGCSTKDQTLQGHCKPLKVKRSLSSPTQFTCLVLRNPEKIKRKYLSSSGKKAPTNYYCKRCHVELESFSNHNKAK